MNGKEHERTPEAEREAEHQETPAAEKAERRADHEALTEQRKWQNNNPPAELLQTVNGALDLQLQRINTMYSLMRDHFQVQQQLATELQKTLQLANTMIQGIQPVIDQLVTVTAALATISETQQEVLDELQSE